LLESFDGLIEKKGYMNRSEAIQTWIRAFCGAQMGGWGRGNRGNGYPGYDHHVRDLSDNHRAAACPPRQGTSALHGHLDAHNCLEVLVVRGKARDVKKIADELIRVKGVKHGKLVMTTTGEELH
jgi:CopG family nickel-responsive transcriptional regulator